MRLYVYDDDQLGVLGADGAVVDITDLVPPTVAPLDRMTALIADWPRLEGGARAAAAVGGGVSLGEVTVRAPQPRPRKLIAAPVNYKRHQEEMGGETGVYPGSAIATIETYVGFVKASSSIVGPDGYIELPFAERRVDHEAEVGVVIGSRARRVSRADALEHVFGYVPLIDVTLRGEEDRSYRKSFDTFTPIGPAIVTADEVGDPGALDFQLTVNGELRQRANTRDLIYDVARLVELYSHAMTLEPGDVIASGTPEGVGALAPGDEVVLSIPAIGELTMPVVARSPA